MFIPAYDHSPDVTSQLDAVPNVLSAWQDVDFGDEPYNDADGNSDVASTAHVSTTTVGCKPSLLFVSLLVSHEPIPKPQSYLVRIDPFQSRVDLSSNPPQMSINLPMRRVRRAARPSDPTAGPGSSARARAAAHLAAATPR